MDAAWVSAPAGCLIPGVRLVYGGGMAASRPIGYWIKQVDRLLEDSFEHVLATEDCTRRHWQVLNTLGAGALAEREIERAVLPFLTANPAGVRSILADLRKRGWAEPLDGSRFRLTAAGRSAHQRLRTAVAAHRGRVSEGVSEQDYRTTLEVLERMAGNLERYLRSARSDSA
jgi:hypothetical protein